MANIPRLIEHLNSRPIAPIFARLNENEKNDEIALKFMCVIDNEMTRKGVYDRMASLINAINYPKLYHELLGFHSYKSFRYFEYHGYQYFDGKYLRCKSASCEFVGPYMLTLTHMAINHNAHYGTRKCLYCKKFELKMHLATDSLQKCYENYRDEEQIPHVFIESTGVYEVISKFYAVLKDCSKKLDVFSQRNLHIFVGKHYNHKESLVGNYGGDIAPEIIVGATRRAPKLIPIVKLNKEFGNVMVHFYGVNASRFYVSRGDPYLVNEESLEYSVQDEQQPGTSNTESRRTQDGQQPGTSNSQSSRTQDEQQPGTSNSESSQKRTIERVYSMNDRSETGSRALSSMSMGSNIDPFIQYLGTLYDNLGSKSKKNKAQLALLEVIQKLDDEEND